MKEYHDRVKKYLAGGVHYNFRLPWEETPIYFSRSQNSTLWDMDGKQYLDFYARFGASIIGHGNKEYSERLKETIDRILSVSHSDLDAETVEIIAKCIPSAELIRFGLSGTEVIQNALRLARAWTGKNRFIRFEGHYHGNADNIMGGRIRKDENNYIPYDYPGDFKQTDGRAQKVLENQSFLLPWNNIDLLEELLTDKANEIAAIITEPICISSGSIMPAPNYLEKMRKLCDDNNIVLIFDEVITGIRMGLGGAQKVLNVVPDLTILGKAMGGGGVPVAALVGKREIMQLIGDKKVVHAGTFNGYPLGAAAVKTTMEILSRDGESALTEMNKKMKSIHAILEDHAKSVGLPLVIQGPLSCASYHCTSDILTHPSEYTSELMFLDIILNNNLTKHGILVSTFSRLYPNISLSDCDIECFNQNVVDALIETKVVYEQMRSL